MSNQSDIAIKVENLSKVFKLYSKPSDMLLEMFSRHSRHQEFWALKDISFEVKRGEVIGVIGCNGAGKSTLLKILAGTLDKSSGTVEINGKMAAILELGSGFHEEYTGLENIYIGGLCIGMTREEINKKIKSIIDFSELTDFINNPLKTYSSGMKSRLMFSLAFCENPELFIVDEALSTGDQFFVEKCIQRIQEIVRNGTTGFYVSHNINMVRRFCNRAILLDKGKIVQDGNTETVCNMYEQMILKKIQSQLLNNDQSSRLGTGEAKISHIEIIGSDNRILEWGKPVAFRIIIESHRQIDGAGIGLIVETSERRHVYAFNSLMHFSDYSGNMKSSQMVLQQGINIIEMEIPHLMLNAGSYAVSVCINPRANYASRLEVYDMWERCFSFSVKSPYDSYVNASLIEQPVFWKCTHQ
jgi:lipopolysaccharide transport system ATP-binding protein